MQPQKLTVRQLNMYVRSLLEGDVNLASVALVGELSGFKNHYSSGHWYFTLKDSEAAVKSVMFKGNALRVKFLPSDGQQVVCRGYVSLYEKDGQYQFYAESMEPLGEGDLAAEFERIKNKLEAEGLFSADRKKSLPSYPQKIGVITSETGAALQDILDISRRRYPLASVTLFPALVQGAGAPNSLINALDKAYSYNDIDLIIIGRGGGSAEDLSCFNSEQLARKIALSKVPVISAVGHEVDFTICDFVSDLRAPTPSAAAELALPDTAEILDKINSLYAKTKNSAFSLLQNANLKLNALVTRRCYSNPEHIFSPFEFRLDALNEHFKSAYILNIKNYDAALNRLAARLEALSPKRVMERGYSAVFCGDKLISNSADIEVNSTLDIRFAKGRAKVTVLDKTTE